MLAAFVGVLLWPEAAYASDFSHLGLLVVQPILWMIAVALLALARIRKIVWRRPLGMIAGPMIAFVATLLLVGAIFGAGDLDYDFDNRAESITTITYLVTLAVLTTAVIRFGITILTASHD